MTQEAVIKKSLNLFFILFLTIDGLLGGIMVVFYRSEVVTYENTLRAQEKYSIALNVEATRDILDNIVSDLHFLVGQNEVHAFLDNHLETNRAAMGAEYFRMIEQKHIYDQIRFLDETGTEVVRVNYNNGSPEVVTKDRLQNKGKRYYFEDCFALGAGEVFVSPLDLNIESGEVERPLKPMIRIGTPVFDNIGRKWGIVILNYMAEDLLNRIRKTTSTSPGIPMLLNSDGYWLLGPNADVEWGFMFKDRVDISFAKKFPWEWAEMSIEKKGQILTQRGLFTYDSIYPLQDGHKSSTGSTATYTPSKEKLGHDNYVWIIASHIPTRIIQSHSNNLLLKLFLFGTGIFVVIAVGAWFMAMAITRRKIYQAQLTAMAHYDTLTGLPNRILFFDRLNQILQGSLRYQRSFALLYVDLDGFKEVNDALGHKAGDEVLVEVSQRILGCRRKTDTVSRLGGDEFVVLLTDVRDLRGITLVAEKIIQSLEKPISLTHGETTVGSSIGISIFPEHGEDVDILLHRADEAMYVSKRSGKNRYTWWEPEHADMAEPE